MFISNVCFGTTLLFVSPYPRCTTMVGVMSTTSGWTQITQTSIQQGGAKRLVTLWKSLLGTLKVSKHMVVTGTYESVSPWKLQLRLHVCFCHLQIPLSPIYSFISIQFFFLFTFFVCFRYTSQLASRFRRWILFSHRASWFRYFFFLNRLNHLWTVSCFLLSYSFYSIKLTIKNI